MNISQPMNKELSLEEITQLKKTNTTFKKTLSQLKEKLTELKELKNELTSITDELIHFDIIDILSESIINESNLETLISITKSVKNCKHYFSKSNINLEYLEKTRNLEKILKIKSFNKLISLMNQGDGFVNDLKVKELIDLNEDLKNIFKKHFFMKRQKEFYKKIVMAKNKQSVCYLIQHELFVKNVLFGEEGDFYLYDVLTVYFDKLSKEEIVNFFYEESDEESEKVFVKYLRMFYEERFKEESVVDL